MKISGYIKESINEGDGLRTVIFFSGCPFRCNECHNPESQNPDYGIEFTDTIQEKIIQYIKNNPLIEGVTLCGGEPFFNPEEVLYFVLKLKQEIPDINIWSYSGYTYEQLLDMPDKRMLLEEVDVLIDGLFISQLKDLTLKFRGSSNQRVIDVDLSMQEDDVILYML